MKEGVLSKMKNNLSLLLVLLLMGSFLIPTVGNAEEDLTTQQKYDALAAKGIFNGINGESALDQNMNRAQFARVAALILGLEGIGNPDTKVVTEAPFSDVSLNHWAVEEIAAAKEAGLMQGNGNGTFNPNSDISIQELAVVRVRALALDPVEGAEIEGAADWAAGYIQALLDNGFNVPTNYTQPATRLDLAEASYDTDKVITEKKEEEKKKQEEQSSYLGSDSSPVQAIVGTPTALPEGGTVTLGTHVTLSSATVSAAVYYTTDLSEPTTSSTLYTEPITLTSSTTIKAIAVKPGSTNSSVARFEYTVTMPIVLPDSISPMTEGQPYNHSVAKVSGGTGAVTYAVTNGALPAGLTLNSSTGSITGTPRVSGAYNFTISATDSATPPATVTRQYTDTITPSFSNTALDLINASVGTWTNVDETTFDAAGITGVSSSNLAAVLEALDSHGNAPWTVSQIQTIVDSLTTNQSPLDLINAASESGSWTGVDATTFATAGIIGVTSENLYNVQYYLENNAQQLPRTLDQIQEIVNEAIQDMMVTAIYDYLNHFGGGSRPTVEVFALAGITGVDASNLDTILAELSWAYQEAKDDMFGTPMSTKQDIQDVVDRVLTF